MARVVVVGGANVDVVARPQARPVPATGNLGSVAVAPRGVGRNIAENLARLGTPTHLLAAVGADAHGRLVDGATLVANVALVRHDARLGATIATAHAGSWGTAPRAQLRLLVRFRG